VNTVKRPAGYPGDQKRLKRGKEEKRGKGANGNRNGEERIRRPLGKGGGGVKEKKYRKRLVASLTDELKTGSRGNGRGACSV